MAKLETLPASAPLPDIMRAFRRDGAAIIENAIDTTLVDKIMAEVLPYMDSTASGRDDFTGRQTQRTGALIARSPAAREAVMHSAVIDAARDFLLPFAERIILHLTQTIRIQPGQGKQPLHRDRLAWGNHMPLTIEPQFNTLWALTDFTTENGATRVVPGSQTWDWEQRATPEQICQAAMPKGSVLLYSGSVIHSGGENRSDAARVGMNITYCLGWLRQEENQYLSCPPAVARELSPELQDLLGYTQGNYALGYWSDPLNKDIDSGVLPPELALGRKPNSKFSASDVVNSP